MLFKTIAIFGSTGSIGKSTLNVIRNDREKFSIKILIAKNDVKTLIQQAIEFEPEYVVIENENLLTELQFGLKHHKNCKVFAGIQAILDVAKIQCDLVVSAIVGSAGVRPTLNAISAKSNIALANKESLVCAGEIIMRQAKINNVKIIPVDSEHNAIFQIFEQDNLALIDDITLTASGGPFFNSNRNFKDITVAEALKHPNWNMGAKISIDSATMMNKGLEMIEAYYLFPIGKEQIKILVHPQSIIHGFVNYKDGASLAMLSLPDMQVPISYALNYPLRMSIKIPKMDLSKIHKLEFYEANDQKFEAIKICRQALEVGGNALVILNASNEIAVEKFLRNEISFDQITKIVSQTLEQIPSKKLDSIDEVMLNDFNAREIAKNIKF
ncbi:MAG: 1-deoxy-D-xylulose-5-phosphate reductoisomerase [Rickettsiales bacterium]